MKNEFIIGDFKFVDCTSYGRDDKERIPTTFEAKLGDIRIVITNGHRDYRPEWIFRCYNLGFDVSQIKNCRSKEDAAKYAIIQCRKKAVSFYNELKCGG